MSATKMPAVAVVPTPGRWRSILELCKEVERRGFAGVYAPSLGEATALCEALALTTERIRFGTSIVNIYTRHPADWARTAAVVHELSGGRFDFGIGVSHGPMNRSLGLATGKPLADVRAFVEALRSARGVGELPPVVLATLRDPMIRLAGELGDGMVFANASLSRTPRSLAALPEAKRNDPAFFVGNMIPVCISDDAQAAAARNRKTLVFYLQLPNYRRYWRDAGYVEEMDAVEKALAEGRDAELESLMSERWLADCTLFGSAAKVRDGVDAWRAAGVTTPILVPSSATGNQMKAFEELFAAYA